MLCYGLFLRNLIFCRGSEAQSQPAGNGACLSLAYYKNTLGSPPFNATTHEENNPGGPEQKMLCPLLKHTPSGKRHNFLFKKSSCFPGCSHLGPSTQGRTYNHLPASSEASSAISMSTKPHRIVSAASVSHSQS